MNLFPSLRLVPRLRLSRLPFDDNSTSAPHGPQLLGKRIHTTDGPTQLETECEQTNANENA